MKTFSDISQCKSANRISLPSSSLQILCLTDNDRIFERVESWLLDEDFEFHSEIIHLTSLAEAIDFFESNQCCDTVLFDADISEAGNAQTLEDLNRASEGVAVIALCAETQRKIGAELAKHGAQDFLCTDNLGPDLLQRTIRHTLERRRARQELGVMDARLQKSSFDLESAQLQLIQVEKLNSLGRLAAGVAHEVKNPLATLQMGVDYFHRSDGKDPESDRVMITHMQEAITRANRIILGMLDYSRSDGLQLELCNINSTLRKALGMVRHEILKHRVKLVNCCTDPLPAVKIDEGKIEQVLINILSNAMQAMAGHCEKRILKISTSWGVLGEIAPEVSVQGSDSLQADDYVICVAIRDCGGGIPEKKLERVFEPFFTTKPAGEGTGLGLSVAKNIIDLHQGHFQIQNAVEPDGLEVKILLKAYEKAYANSYSAKTAAARVVEKPHTRPHLQAT